MVNQSYIPGVCNINRTEVAYRRKLSLLGLSLTLVFFVAAIIIQLNPALRAIIVFIPVFTVVINYLQVRNQFCVSYAAKGMHNAEDDSEAPETVDDIEARLKDRVKARRMRIQATMFSIIFVLLSLFIPTSF